MIRHAFTHTERDDMRPRIIAVLAALTMVLGFAAPANADWIWGRGVPIVPAPVANEDPSGTYVAPATTGKVSGKGAAPIAKGALPEPGKVTTKSSPNARLAGPYWFYNTAYQNVTAGTYNGLFAYMTVDKPFINSVAGGDSHSLIQLGVIQGSGSSRQAIEFGWTVDPSVNGGSTDPHLFAGYRVNNVFGGYNTGCIDNPSNPVDLGDTLVADIGTVPTFSVWQAPTGTPGWWLSYKSQYVCYFPLTLWSSAGITFTSATQMQGFGELATWNTTPCGNIGRGLYATGTNASSRISTWSLMPVGASAWVSGSQSLSVQPAVPAGVWTITPSTTSGSPSPTSARLGGPGYNAAGTGAGTLTC
jgi:hypothetical protein